MHPDLLHLPEYGVRLQSVGAMLVTAALVAIWLVPRSVESIAGIDRRRARVAVICLVLAALIGGRLHFIANAPNVFAGRWLEALKPWFGGFHVGGGFLLALVALVVAARRLEVPVARFADGILPPVGISVAIGRLGCFLQGCCIGGPCERPWCLSYPAGGAVFQLQVALGLIPPDAERSLPLHPLQLYFAAAALLVSAVSFAVARRRRYDGEVALVTFFLFWASTAALEGWRAPWTATPLWGPFRQLHWMALVLAALSFAGLLVAETSYRLRSSVRGAARS